MARIGDGAQVTTEEVTVRVSGPDRADFGIIDLPGIIHNGQGAGVDRGAIVRMSHLKSVVS